MTGAPTRVRNPADNLQGALWLIADMALNIWALSIVKAFGADYPAAQLVFLRASIGFLVLTPWLWRDRSAFATIENAGLHLLRVGLSAVTLAASFYAISRLSFALFSAINFTRPILLMIFAALLLREPIGPVRWVVAGIGLMGAVIAAAPATLDVNSGLASQCFAVVTGTLAVILTRRLKGTPTIVMMVFYAAGLALLSAPLAIATWQPIPRDELWLLLCIGLFAQLAQFCFLHAHWRGDAGVLGPVSYASLVLSATAGYVFFAEIPTPNLLLGAVLIVLSCLWLARPDGR
ncbi:MAG: DMT family transporter [Pseudomonadota bacterium]